MSSDVAELDRKIGGLPDGWRRVRLGDVFSERKEKGRVGLPVASVSIEHGLVLRSSLDRRVASDLPPEGHALVRMGDIAYNMMRMWQGACGLAEADCIISPAYVVMTPSADVEPTFAHIALRSEPMISLLHGYSQGIVDDRLRLYPDAFAQVPINLPPLDEQWRIAEVLRSVHKAIAAAEAVIGQLREARSHRLEALMALPGTFRRIDEICRLSGGNGFPIKHQGKATGQYPFAKVSDMNRPGNEVQMRHAENYVDAADLRTLKAKTFPIGTTFFPKVGATLLTNKRRIAAVEMLVDNNVMGAVATDVDMWFLYYAFCTIDMADYVQPGAVPSVNQRTIGQIVIPVPDRAVQVEFAEAVRDLDVAIEMQSDALGQLTAAEQALMSDLLSGRVRVPA